MAVAADGDGVGRGDGVEMRAEDLVAMYVLSSYTSRRCVYILHVYSAQLICCWSVPLILGTRA